MSEENNAAITVATPTGLATSTGGGLFSSRLFKLKPGNLQLVSSMTHQEGAIPGKIRIIETNQHFAEIQVVILAEPQEPKPRAYRQKDVYSKEGLLCFSTDGIQPSEHAKFKQAETCAACPKASWATWRANKISSNLPQCKDYWRVLLVERTTKLPYWINIGGKNDKPFKEACQNIARTIGLIQAEIEQQNRAGSTPRPNPEIYDVSFTMFVKKDGAHFVLGFKDFAPLALEARGAFGAIFQDFAKRRAEYDQASVADESATQSAVVDAAVSGAHATQQTAQNTPQPVRVAPRTPRAPVVIPKGPTITITPQAAAEPDEITI